MAIAVDGSTPAVVGGAANTVTTASFTAPANALLVACVASDGSGSDITTAVSDTGGLTWTTQVTRQITETTSGGFSRLYTARTTSSASRTVSSTWSAGGAGPNLQQYLKVYVLTGVDVDGTPVDTVGANNESGSTTNNYTTPSLTPGATGLLVGVDCDWTASGNFQASSDLTQDTATSAGISYCSGYKTVTSGVGTTANWNAAGTGAVQHKEVRIITREPAAGGGTPAPLSRLALMGVG